MMDRRKISVRTAGVPAEMVAQKKKIVDQIER
jgi:hypothetical protein